jgi:hypothetical protein
MTQEHVTDIGVNFRQVAAQSALLAQHSQTAFFRNLIYVKPDNQLRVLNTSARPEEHSLDLQRLSSRGSV